MKQKDVFLRSEGDAWFSRNQKCVAARILPEGDPLLPEMLDFLPKGAGGGVKVLEVGCGDGSRLAWLKKNLSADCYGIEPSAQAVAAARSKGINVQQGTADVIPFDSRSFDVVIFGFCLYLCDREDLFRIASEADRVLRSPGWMMMLDFYSPAPKAINYHHRPGVQSYKMDYRKLFTWHPDYECVTHKVRHHAEVNYTDDADEWVAISVMRKSNGETSI